MVVLAEAASSADIAGEVTVGVASLAVAGVASPADFAEVASLADIAEGRPRPTLLLMWSPPVWCSRKSGMSRVFRCVIVVTIFVILWFY